MIVTETQRLSLRRLTATDAPFFCRLLNTPAFLQNIGDKGVRTPEEARRHIQEQSEKTYKSMGFGMYLVESKVHAQPIGICGLVKRESLPRADLGFALLPEFWGSGYAFESASAVMTHAKNQLGFSRLFAIITPTNDASSKLLGKLNFRFKETIQLAPSEMALSLYESVAAPARFDTFLVK